MSPEILDYNKERLRNWDWLTMLGKPVWNTKALEKMACEDRQLEAFNELKNLIGQPSLDAWRHFLTRFNSDSPGIAATHCVFYYYDRKPGSKESIKRESRVFFPFDVVINPNLISWDWIRSPLWDKGELGEYWVHDELRVSPRHLFREQFMVFGDIDEKASDEQFLEASRELGTPFLVADTERGHHVLFPLLFGSGIGGSSSRDAEVLATKEIGLVLAVEFEDRYLWRSHGNYEFVLRVTPGLRRKETPTISALVWDGNTIVKSPNNGNIHSPAPKST